MHIDDRLATVLAVSATGDNQQRVQFRQLVDLLGTMPAGALGPGIDRAMLRLGELARLIPAPERAAAIDRSGLRLRNPRLVVELASDAPTVAASAIRIARLDDEAWLDILPALPPAARGLLRLRSDLGPTVLARLEQLGAASPGLPAPVAEADEAPVAPAPPQDGEERGKVLPLRIRRDVIDGPPRTDDLIPADTLNGTAPTEVAAGEAAAKAPAVKDAAPGSGAPGGPVEPAAAATEGIGAIVRRIEAFRRNRDATRPPANDAPRLPLADDPAPTRLQAFAFACDSSGRIVWCDATIAGMIVGMLLPLADDPAGTLASAFRRRLPVRGTQVALDGPGAIAGDWLLDAAPEFDGEGRFTGYTGKLRRPPQIAAAAPVNPEAVRVRQILHELRTPVNAIQGFAELIHQQLVGPVPHGYRALAAGIAADAAQMLAGFDELDRLARLDSAALVPDAGEADLAELVAALIRQLEPFTGPRQSAITLTAPPAGCPVRLTRDEAERLGWRLLATLASAAHPGEQLAALLQTRDGATTLTLTLPAALAALPDPFEGPAPLPGQAVSGGLFGGGFALRLAAAEARAAGGSLVFRDHHAVLTLPAPRDERLTAPGEVPNPAPRGVSSTG